MKKTILFIAVIFLYGNLTQAQDNYSQQMQTAVAKLDQAVAVKDYQQLAANFESIAEQEKASWLPWYYAAFCNAKIGWLYQQDGDQISAHKDACRANREEDRGQEQVIAERRH